MMSTRPDGKVIFFRYSNGNYLTHKNIDVALKLVDHNFIKLLSEQDKLLESISNIEEIESLDNTIVAIP